LTTDQLTDLAFWTVSNGHISATKCSIYFLFGPNWKFLQIDENCKSSVFVRSNIFFGFFIENHLRGIWLFLIEQNIYY